MPTHRDFRKAGVISLFLGRLRSESEVEAYLRRGFESDFGFAIDPRDGPEYACRKPATDIQELLAGFSFANVFADRAAEKAAEKGYREANCALVFYNFAYSPPAKSRKGKVEFVGVFPMKTGSSEPNKESRVDCPEHGLVQPTFVCRHLVDRTGVGFNVPDGPPDPEWPFKQAWCNACDEVLMRVGEWNDESEAFADITMICEVCYEKRRSKA